MTIGVCIHSTGQVLLQTALALVSLLWSWIFGPPLSTLLLGNGYRRTLVLALLTGLDADVLSESGNLIQDHLSHVTDVLDNLKVKVEGGGAPRLVRGIVPDVKVRVFERFLD